MKLLNLNLWRIATLVALIVLAADGSHAAWFAGGLWALLNLAGIILTLPIVLLMSALAGGAQADWMSDGFVYFVFLVLPTLLSVAASLLLRTYLDRFPSCGDSRQASEEIAAINWLQNDMGSQ